MKETENLSMLQIVSVIPELYTEIPYYNVILCRILILLKYLSIDYYKLPNTITKALLIIKIS